MGSRRDGSAADPRATPAPQGKRLIFAGASNNPFPTQSLAHIPEAHNSLGLVLLLSMPAMVEPIPILS
jgi:hypothetical protein